MKHHDIKNITRFHNEVEYHKGGFPWVEIIGFGTLAAAILGVLSVI